MGRDNWSGKKQMSSSSEAVAVCDAVTYKNPQARLGRLLRQYRQPNNFSNIAHLGFDLATGALLIGCSIWLCEKLWNVEAALVFSLFRPWQSPLS